MEWIKKNLLTIINLLLLVYMIIQQFTIMSNLKNINTKIDDNAKIGEYTNSKLDYVESDINEQHHNRKK